MTRIAWTSLIISITISSLVLNMGSSLQNYEESNQDNLLDLSNSDSWSKIVKEGGIIYSSHCALVNESLYIIGRLEFVMLSEHYLYVSKFSSSGDKEWELSIRICFYSDIYTVFDSNNNLIILYPDCSSNPVYKLIKLNSLGEILFSTEISLDWYVVSFVLGENNSVLLIGHNYQHLDPEKIFITKYNNAGQSLWNSSFYSSSEGDLPIIVTDSEYNMYIYFENNSLDCLAKINGSGVIIWKIVLENEVQSLAVDFYDNVYLMGVNVSFTGYILKLNSSGNQIKEISIEHFDRHLSRFWQLNDLLIYNQYMSIVCYNLSLDLKWTYKLPDSMRPVIRSLPFIALDANDNVYASLNNGEGYNNLVKISSTGVLLSKISWGGTLVRSSGFLIIDLDSNIYSICSCRYYDGWNDRYDYTVVVKNPKNGDTPPLPRNDLDVRDYILFSVIGISSVFSLISFVSILRRNKKRIS